MPVPIMPRSGCSQEGLEMPDFGGRTSHDRTGLRLAVPAALDNVEICN